MGNGAERLAARARRRALRLAHANGALWAAGNGLTSGAAIGYLVQELGAKGLGVSLILAVPALVGVLRLATPALIVRCGSAKPVCLAASLAAYLLLVLVPLAPLAAERGLLSHPLAALIGVVCLHQLLEYVGQVALLSWLGDLAPSRLRGRFFGRRQVWQLAATIPVLLASGYGIDLWKKLHPGQAWQGYAAATGTGAMLLLASLTPLLAMPATRATLARSASEGNPLSVPRLRFGLVWRASLALAPLADCRFRRLLLFGCWFSFFNGLTQSAQNIYPFAVLSLGLFPLLAMQTAMRCGQLALSPLAGRMSDRYGNRPTMVASQALVAAAPLFFLLATPRHPWLLAGAWLLWSAYAGLNVCLPSLLIELSPPGGSAARLAMYWGLTSVFFAGSTLAGGLLHDGLRDHAGLLRLGSASLDPFALQFGASLITRGLGVLLLARLIEPGAWRWSEIVRGKRNQPGERGV